MKTRLGFLTEEGRTRRKNATRRICVYATLMFLVAGAAGYAIHRYWISTTLTPLQRVYFKQYAKASFRSYLSNSRSRYTTLVAIVREPGGTKDLVLSPTDENVEPKLDAQGRIEFDELHHPVFQLKPDVEAKRVLWVDDTIFDARAYQWFKAAVYDGRSIPDIWRPAWLGSIFLFFSGLVGLTALDLFAHHRYMKGEPLRGTRELLPQAYTREHRKHSGFEFKIYATA